MPSETKRYTTRVDSTIEGYLVTVSAMSKTWYLMGTHRDGINLISEWEHLDFHEPSWRNQPRPA